MVYELSILGMVVTGLASPLRFPGYTLSGCAALFIAEVDPQLMNL